MNEWLRRNLVCPRDYSELRFGSNVLFCGAGHEYRVVDGIPIMLLPDVPQTLWVSNASLETRQYVHNQPVSNLFVESLGLSEHERSSLSKEEINSAGVDPVVRYIVQATCGNLYKPLVRRLPRYPIPELRLPDGKGELFLDIGCNWGRWCIAAAKKGYRVVGVDPSLGAVAAARRVSAQLNLPATYIVADARFLPFPAASFDFVFSYSVFQHFSKKDVRASVAQVARVLKTNGTSLIQMANMYGLRSFTHQAHRRFRDARDFEVRYWTPRAIKNVFDELIGTTSLEVDGYFGLGIQKTDANLLPFKYRLVVYLSELMRAASHRIHGLVNLADSIYLRSAREDRQAGNLQHHTTIRVAVT
jgi:SAM-dependent methyltransferase